MPTQEDWTVLTTLLAIFMALGGAVLLAQRLGLLTPRASRADLGALTSRTDRIETTMTQNQGNIDSISEHRRRIQDVESTLGHTVTQSQFDSARIATQAQIAELNSKIDTMATKDEIADLRVAIERAEGQNATILARLEGQGKAMDRMHEAITRMDEHLMNRGGS